MTWTSKPSQTGGRPGKPPARTRPGRPASYTLLLLGTFGGLYLVVRAFELMFGSAEAMDSTFAKGTLLVVNGLLLSLMLMAAFYLGEYMWRAFVAA